MAAAGYDGSVLWGIHGGHTGDADSIFLKMNQGALGWERLPDVTTLPRDRDALKEALQQAYPERKAGYYPVAASVDTHGGASPQCAWPRPLSPPSLT